jgi:hypothetical protein
MRPTLRSSLVFVMLCGVAGCGDDPKEGTGNTQSDDAEDAGASDDSDPTDDSETSNTTDITDETNTSGGDSTDTDSTDTDSTSDGELPEPVLEDLPPETPLSDLDDDELAEVCAAYLDTATSLTDNLDGICPAQSVITAYRSGAESDEALQDACVTAEATCGVQVASSQAALSAANCDQAKSCGASIADFNACNLQVAAFNEMVIVPVGELNAPACESTTASQAMAFSLSGGLQFLIWTQQASDAAGGSPTDEGGPCQRIQELCPELGAVLDAFSGIQLPEL